MIHDIGINITSFPNTYFGVEYIKNVDAAQIYEKEFTSSNFQTIEMIPFKNTVTDGKLNIFEGEITIHKLYYGFCIMEVEGDAIMFSIFVNEHIIRSSQERIVKVAIMAALPNKMSYMLYDESLKDVHPSLKNLTVNQDIRNAIDKAKLDFTRSPAWEKCCHPMLDPHKEYLSKYVNNDNSHSTSELINRVASLTVE